MCGMLFTLPAVAQDSDVTDRDPGSIPAQTDFVRSAPSGPRTPVDLDEPGALNRHPAPAALAQERISDRDEDQLAGSFQPAAFSPIEMELDDGRGGAEPSTRSLVMSDASEHTTELDDGRSENAIIPGASAFAAHLLAAESASIGPFDLDNGRPAGAARGPVPAEYQKTELEPANERFEALIAEDDVSGVPEQLTLFPAYPNPFNPRTEISFTVPHEGHVTLTVYDVRGREVGSLFEGEATPGEIHRAAFDAASLASGLYIYRMEFEGHQLSRKMLLTK